MRVATVREFRDTASELLRSKNPFLVTRRGRLAGIFFPSPESTLPIELKRELFPVLSAEIGRQMRRIGVSEKEIQEDFKAWRRARRAAGRRR
jgi:hypothetical protein